MNEDWIGRAVTIECSNNLGIFQGIIKEIDASLLTVVRAFRNGVPLRQPDAQITLRSCDILKISFIEAYDGPMSVTPSVINKPTPVKQPNFLSLNTLEQIEQQQKQMAEAPSKADMNAFVLRNRNGYPTSWGFGVPPTGPPLANAVDASPPNQRNRTKSMASPTNTPPPSEAATAGGRQQPKAVKPAPTSVAQFFNNMIPPKVELRLGAAFREPAATSTATSSNGDNDTGHTVARPTNNGGGGGPVGSKPRSKSLSCNGNGGGSGGGNGGHHGGNGGYAGGDPAGHSKGHKRRQQHALRRENSCRENQTFGTSVDDPLMHEDFDFEGNLALFNKQAIWQTIDQKKLELQRRDNGGNGRASAGDASDNYGKYRHDENILECQPLELRQIHSMHESLTDFVTDEGLIIPSIPYLVRRQIERVAEKCGLSLQRQFDVLARGATELAIMLLGGARRLTPNNCHQWPTIVIICNQSDDEDLRSSLIGATTGRLLSSHELRVFLYLEDKDIDQTRTAEITLYQATGNQIVYEITDLPRPDLVILSTPSPVLPDNIRNWINHNRASTLAIDTPEEGVQGVPIKYSILPILPLNGIHPHKCGKLYLCNLGIPSDYYDDAGIKYKSPFGHKFVIPIHAKD